MGTTTLEKYITESVWARKAGLGKEELAAKLGIDNDYLEMCKEKADEEISRLKSEKYAPWYIAEHIGVNINVLKEYLNYKTNNRQRVNIVVPEKGTVKSKSELLREEKNKR